MTTRMARIKKALVACRTALDEMSRDKVARHEAGGYFSTNNVQELLEDGLKAHKEHEDALKQARLRKEED